MFERGNAQRPGVYVGMAIVYAALAFAALWPALRGDFVSDDIGYVVGNPWIHSLSVANLRAILDPAGPAAAHTANYAPLHLLLHALCWQLFGANPLGHHVVNVLFHVVASALLVALFARAGVPFVAAALGGALFLLHPANVEAVAWVFQLKTIVALALASAALLLEPRRPFAATIVFALALLAKIQAAVAIPVLGVALWAGAPASARSRGARVAVLGVWIAILALALLPELLAFERLGHTELATPLAPWDRARASAGFVGRYLVMATTSVGVSAFHQPELPASWFDPWCLLGLVGAAAIGGRALFVLARRDDEASFWAWAVGGFVPVSQVLSFLYPLADRYLYFILPGLIGAGLVATRAPLARLARAPRSAPSRAALLAAVALLALFGWRSFERAGVWRSDFTLARDAAAHYPNGIPAQLLLAQNAARRGDVDAAVDGAAGGGCARLRPLHRPGTRAGLRVTAQRRALPRRRRRDRGRVDRRGRPAQPAHGARTAHARSCPRRARRMGVRAGATRRSVGARRSGQRGHPRGSGRAARPQAARRARGGARERIHQRGGR